MNSIQKRIRRERLIKLFAVLLLFAVVLAIILLVENMMVAFLLAFVSAYLLAPVVNWMERMGLPRTLAILIPFMAFAGVLTLGAYLLVPMVLEQLESLRGELPKYIDGTKRLIGELQIRVKAFVPAADVNLGIKTETFLLNWTQQAFADLPNIISRVLTVSLLAPFFAFFMLQDGRTISRLFLSLVPNNLFEISLFLQHQINKQMGDFIRARLMEAVIVGLVTWAGLYLVNFPYAPLLAAFAAITNLLPYIGPVVGAVPAAVIAVTNGYTSWNLFLVASVYLTAQIIDAAIIIPLVVAKIVNLHPVTVVIAIIVGAQLMGVIGMIISIPVASVMKLVSTTIYRQVTDMRSAGS